MSDEQLFTPGDIVECIFEGYATIDRGTRGRVIHTGFCKNGDQYIRMVPVGAGPWIDDTCGYRSMNFKLIAGAPKRDRADWKKFIIVTETEDENGSLTRGIIGSFAAAENTARNIVEEFVREESNNDPEFKKAMLFRAVEEFEIAPVPVKSRKL